MVVLIKRLNMAMATIVYNMFFFSENIVYNMLKFGVR